MSSYCRLYLKQIGISTFTSVIVLSYLNLCKKRFTYKVASTLTSLRPRPHIPLSTRYQPVIYLEMFVLGHYLH